MRYRFVQDVQVAGALHVVTVRSQRASALLAAIEVPELPDGVIALTARDIPGDGLLTYGSRSMPILASDVVRYVGEPVALVAARDLGLAQALASSVMLRYAEMPPEERAKAEGSTLEQTLTRGDSSPTPSGTEIGDAYEIVSMPRRFAPPAPQEVVVVPRGQGVVVRAATQHPFHVRSTVAAVLGIPAARVRVVAEAVEGAGGRLFMPSLVAAHAALVAMRASGPARIRYSWREELGVAFRIAGTRTAWRAVPGGEGRAATAEYHLSIEGGACDLAAEEVLGRAVHALVGPYRSEALRIAAFYRSEETVPCEPPPGCGDLEATCARELCADALARAAGMDPAEWRLENLANEGADGAAPAKGRPRASRRPPGLVGALEEVVRMSDFSRKYAAYEAVRERRAGHEGSGVPMRGVGIALATFRPGLAAAGDPGVRVRLRMEKDRRVLVETSAVDLGHGRNRLFARVVSGALGIPEGHVEVAEVDTDNVPYSGPSIASRTASELVPLVRRACAALKGRLRRQAPPCVVESALRAPDESARLVSSVATVAAVELDPTTRALRCSGLWAAVDAGEVLDPEWARSVAAAALVRGLGIALYEESEATVVPVPPAMDPYASLTPSYRVARVSDLGTIEVRFVDRSREHSRQAPGPISELALLGVAPAVASAVMQATGTRVSRLPVGPLDQAADPGERS